MNRPNQWTTACEKSWRELLKRKQSFWHNSTYHIDYLDLSAECLGERKEGAVLRENAWKWKQKTANGGQRGNFFWQQLCSLTSARIKIATTKTILTSNCMPTKQIAAQLAYWITGNPAGDPRSRKVQNWNQLWVGGIVVFLQETMWPWDTWTANLSS